MHWKCGRDKSSVSEDGILINELSSLAIFNFSNVPHFSCKINYTFSFVNCFQNDSFHLKFRPL